jgi:phage shock protein PspC (stress-responsive transcriptional regulator)
MPSLIRFLTVIAVLAGLVYAAMFALTIFVEPEQREMTQRVDSRRINPS